MDIVNDRYKSIKAPSEGVFKDKGSRFMAFAYPIETEEEAKGILASLKKEYHDARHHCFAWRTGHTKDRFRSSDDGEPSGTAGRQILGQIDSAGLSDILIVVVRYFGGIKLGVPGLIAAYRASTADAISKAELTEKTSCRKYCVRFGYFQMNAIMKIVKDMSLEVISQDFGTECMMEVKVRLSAVPDFEEATSKIEGCSISSLS